VKQFPSGARRRVNVGPAGTCSHGDGRSSEEVSCALFSLFSFCLHAAYMLFSLVALPAADLSLSLISLSSSRVRVITKARMAIDHGLFETCARLCLRACRQLLRRRHQAEVQWFRTQVFHCFKKVSSSPSTHYQHTVTESNAKQLESTRTHSSLAYPCIRCIMWSKSNSI
jgi:hypothetical protein